MTKPFIEIDAEHFALSGFETRPIEGYEVPKNKETGEQLPKCCSFHEGVYNGTKDWLKIFPNCCNEHRDMISKWWFNKNNYVGIEMKVVKQLSFTEYHITKQIEINDWYKDITDYIEYNVSSFGQPAIGLHMYLNYLKYRIRQATSEIPNNKKIRLIEFIESYYNPVKTETTSFNILYSTYKKWLRLFPFDISFFVDLKPQLEGQLPILTGASETNKYTGFTKAKMHTESSLIDVLINLTNNLLDKVNIPSLRKQGAITDIQANQLEFAEAALNTKTAEITKQFSKGELRYVKVLKKWLQLHKDYFGEVAPLLKALSLPPTNTENDTIRYTAKHYVLAYLMECHAKGDSFPIGQKKELEQIGNRKMGAGKGNRFYKVFNEIMNKDLNVESNLSQIGGEDWRKAVIKLSDTPELVEEYLQNKQL